MCSLLVLFGETCLCLRVILSFCSVTMNTWDANINVLTLFTPTSNRGIYVSL